MTDIESPAEAEHVTLTKSRRVAGLDSIRLICALWVVFGHFGAFPLIEGIDKTSLTGKMIAGFYNNLFSGPAAVIVFFVISGFCINYPYRHGERIPLVSYYSRRYLRILVPMAAAILLGVPLALKLGLLNDSILWSLLAEEIYYLLYPVLRRLAANVGWKSLVGGAYVLSVLVVLHHPEAGNYPSYGPGFNWLLGLPCWLLGCKLASSIDANLLDNIGRKIWIWRAGVWSLAWTCSTLRFHSPVKYPWTLNLFAVFVYFWLKREVAYFWNRKPPAILENNGKWSYSIYLMHLHGQALLALLALPSLGYVLGWFSQTAFILLICYMFYRVVERPSHAMARRVSRRMLVLKQARAVSA
jgi:peptidoglycan/LPS O-acetylase OafA/YrhL